MRETSTSRGRGRAGDLLVWRHAAAQYQALLPNAFSPVKKQQRCHLITHVVLIIKCRFAVPNKSNTLYGGYNYKDIV